MAGPVGGEDEMIWQALMPALILMAAVGVFVIVIWRIRKDPRRFIDGVGVLSVVAGSFALVVLLPELPTRWREFLFWRGIIVGSLLLGVPLIFSKKRLALVLAAVGYCVLRLGIAGLFWIAKHA